ncbi:MAG: chromosome partitioning protein, partial [Proteobacteria bacterium]|nr:chromosome partitioning protein [Pseudomonadota bacterium]
MTGSNDMRRPWPARALTALGALMAAVSIALAAYAAHGLEPQSASRLQLAAVFAFGHGVALAALARTVDPTLRVLSGIARADRWPELRPSALEVVLELCRSLATTTVVDCGFALEQDEELAYDTAAPRRNGATLTALESADTVYAVGTADPVGLQRLVRGLSELKEAVPGVQPVVVVNRLRASAIPGNAEQEVRAALLRYAGVDHVLFVPHDVDALDRALAAGRTLAEAVPSSPVRLAVAAM